MVIPMDPNVKPYQISIKAKGKNQPGLTTSKKKFSYYLFRKYVFNTIILSTT
jgi:hypothetical protein